MSQARNWCFTLNNPTLDEIVKLCECTEYSYMCFDIEFGEQNKQEHLQGYVEFDSPKRRNEIKGRYLLNNGSLFRAHLEPRKGTQEQAIAYCNKTNNVFTEIGTKKEQGKRNDLTDIKKIIDEGGSLEDVANQHFGDFTRYNFQKYIDVKKKLNHGHCDVQVYRGSESMYQWHDQYKSVCYLSMNDNLNTYEGEELLVLLDSFDQTILERFARSIPVKVKYGYETRTILPRYVIFHNQYFGKKSSFYDFVTEVSGVILDLQEIDLYPDID